MFMNRNGAIMTEHYRYIYSFVLSRVSNFADAEDIVQETFLTALLKRSTLADESKMKYWLRGIAENKIRQYFRAQAIASAKTVSVDAEGACIEPSYTDLADEALVTLDEVRRLEDALLALSDDLRQCAVVNILCGLSGDECAEILAVPVQTVYNRIHKTKKLLREKLGGSMEISIEKFDLMLKEGMTEVERVCRYLQNDIITLRSEGRYEDIAALILTAPVLASDSVEAHKQIVQEIVFALRIMRLPEEHQVVKKLVAFGEQEIRLIEKLGVEGVIEWDSGNEYPVYTFYDDFADFYAVTHQFERAFEYCEKSVAAGNPSKMRLACVYDDAGRYREAVAVFKEVADEPRNKSDRSMAYNRIANCYKKLGEHENSLQYQLKNIALIRAGEVYETDSEAYRNLLAGELYFISTTYARLGERGKMLDSLREAVGMNGMYRDWAKQERAFEAYKDDVEFKAISACIP